MPVWRGDGTNKGNEINNKIYLAWNNTEDIANVRVEGFLVDKDNDPAPKNISNTVPVTVKDNGLPLNQEWGWDNTCNQQKGGNHQLDTKVSNQTK